MKKNNKFDINLNSIEEQLKDIMNDYSSIEFSQEKDQPSVVVLTDKLNHLNRENEVLENEIILLKNYINKKIDSLSGESKFEQLFRKFLDYYSTDELSEKEIREKFNAYVDKELSKENFDNKKIDFDSHKLNISNSNNSLVLIENIFERALKRIKEIQSSKNSFIDNLSKENNLMNASSEELLKALNNYLDGFVASLSFEINDVYLKEKATIQNNDELVSFTHLKENVINIISENVEILKNEFKDVVSFNNYLDKKINSFKINNHSILHDLENKSGHDSFSFNQPNNGYSNLESKVNSLIELINNMNSKNDENFFKSLEEKTQTIIQEKINTLESKIDNLMKDVIEKNNNFIENQNKVNSQEELEKMLQTIKESINEENKNFITKIIENNQHEKTEMLGLLNSIKDQNAIINDGLEFQSKHQKNSNKLFELEQLILRQTDEIDSLLREKNDALFEIEKIINGQRKSNINQDTLDNIQRSIINIADSFNEKFDALESNFSIKLDDLNLTSNISDEISRNLGNVEHRLLQNYESIKNNFNDNLREIKNRLDDKDDVESIKFKMNDILNVVNDVKDTNSYANIERLLDTKGAEIIDKKIIELESKFNEVINIMNENNKANLSNNFDETNKIIQSFEEVIDTLRKEKEEFVSSVQSNSEYVINKTKEESERIVSAVEKFVETLDQEKQDAKIENDNLIQSIITNNENEKKYIISLIKKMEEDQANFIDGAQAAKTQANSQKLMELDSLIIKQNDDLERLFNEKQEALDLIDRIMNGNWKTSMNQDTLDTIQKSIINIADSFNEKINALESNFSIKLDDLNLSSSISDEISKNIGSVEHRLLQNYEIIKNDFNDNLREIKNRLDDKDDVESLKFKMNDILNVVNDVKDTNSYANIERLLDTKGAEIIDRKIIELESKFNEVINIMNENNKANLSNNIDETNKIIQSFEEVIDTLRKEKEEFVSSVQSNSEYVINKTKEESERIVSAVEKFVETLDQEKHEAKIENDNLIKSIIMNNENEKKYIISLIKKMEEDQSNFIDGAQAAKTQANSQKLMELDSLIIKQNDELERLLNEKQEALDLIERMVVKNKENLNNKDSLEVIKDRILDIAQAFETRINGLEDSFNQKFDELNIQSLTEQLVKESIASSEISKNINDLENKLMNNYEQIRDNFNESFDVILSSINNQKEVSVDSISDLLETKLQKVEHIYKDIDIKNEFFRNEIFEKINELSQQTNNPEILNEGFRKIENNLVDAFERIRNDSEIKLDNIEMKIDNITLSNEELHQKVDLNNKLISSLGSDLISNFDRYEQLLIQSLEKDKQNYNDIKSIIDEHFIKRENQLSAYESTKLMALQKKLDNLVDLIDLQENEINSLVSEKDEVLKMLNKELNTSELNEDEIKNISDVIEQKIEMCLKRILESPENISTIISSNNANNEIAQVNDKIDEFSQYLNENIKIHQSNIQLKDLITIENYKDSYNLDIIQNKMIKIQDQVNNLINRNLFELSKQELMDVQYKINDFKNRLITTENELMLLKSKVNLDYLPDEIKNREEIQPLLKANNEKISLVEELISKNLESINYLNIEKENTLNSLQNDISMNNSDSDNTDLELLLQTQANLTTDKLIDEIKKVQEKDFNEINYRFSKIEDKINELILPNSESSSELNEVSNKIKSIENMIEHSFDSINEINRELINTLEDKIKNSDDLLDKVIKKFEEDKEEIKQEINEKTNSLKQEIISLKADQILEYKNQLNKYVLDLETYKNLTNNLEKTLNDKNVEIVERDRLLINQEFRLNEIDEIIEKLNLQIDSFIEEKNELVNLMSDKLNYLEKLNNPSDVNEYIELETDNINSDKFKQTVLDETAEIINDKFNGLKNSYDKEINEINNLFDELKRTQDECENIKPNVQVIEDKKDENILTIENRLKNLEKLIFEKEQKISELKDNSLYDEKKINQSGDYTLKLINDNVIFYVDELERRKKEIELFYDKLRTLKSSFSK